jgi:hypothetical protein
MLINSRVSGQQKGEWPECSTFAPGIDQTVERFAEVSLYRM